MTVVLGYIPGDLGEAALATAVDEARRRDTDLVVVNTTRGDRLVDRRYAHDDQAIALGSRLAASGVPHEVRRFTSDGLAADALLEVAGEVGAEVVVIGLRHRTPVGKLIMGSTAQRVLLEAACPVLTVKLPR
ncbi:universal stress protein [Nocardioides coralli]|uniref:universal stress protein n=1 Tax=Nocardioides coralli TaxID=2872154 RepID=UPI001CA4404A|nr:universal stress protein [Nocardioides coralli]QZY29495.1 universal stress protein [Nocardioides coralli]